MYLLDTVVVSELSKRQPHPDAVRWLDAAPEDLVHISVMTVGELERGLAKAQRDDPHFARRLGPWLSGTLRQFEARIIEVDVAIARAWGRLTHQLGHATPDLMIAATALVHDLTVVTRNTRHFDRTGVPILNPYEAGA